MGQGIYSGVSAERISRGNNLQVLDITKKATLDDKVAFSMPIGRRANAGKALNSQERDAVENICRKLGRTVVFEDLRKMYYKGEIFYNIDYRRY